MAHKKHKGRPARQVDPKMCLLALQRFGVRKQPVDDEFAAPLEIAAYTALDTITRGHGAKAQWDLVARCLNQAWLMAKNGTAPEVLDTLNESHRAMRRMVPMFNETGKVQFVSEADQRVVEEALSLWGAQLRMSSIGEVDSATRIIEKEFWKYGQAA